MSIPVDAARETGLALAKVTVGTRGGAELAEQLVKSDGAAGSMARFVAEHFKETLPATLANAPAHVPGANRFGQWLTESSIERMVANQAKVGSTWTPLDTELAALRAASDRVQQTRGVAALFNYGRHPDFDKHLKMAELMAGEPNALQAYSHYRSAQLSVDGANSALRPHAITRVETMRPAFQADFAAMDMPRPNLFVSGSSFQRAESIYLADRKLVQPYGPSLEKVKAHEGTHHEQQVAVTFFESDRLGIGTKPTPAKMDTLLLNLKSTYHWLSERAALRFIEQRGGRQLMPETASRAEQLGQSSKDLFDHPLRKENTARLINNIQRNRWTLSHQHGSEPLQEWTRKLHLPEGGDAFARKMFGDNHAEMFRAKITSELPRKLGSQWTPEESSLAHRLFGDAFNQSLKHAKDLDKQRYNIYFDSLHEREARYNGAIAYLQALKLQAKSV